MIEVTDLQDHVFYINADKIEIIEENPETQVVMTTGKRYYVKEKAKAIARSVIRYHQQCAEEPALLLKEDINQLEES